MPRELLLKKVPFPLPTPTIFNLDQIEALSTDTVVSENGVYQILSILDLYIDFSHLRSHFLKNLCSYICFPP